MEDKEAAREKDEPVVVSKYPDVCKSPAAPVPYPIVAPLGSSTGVAETVRATKVPVFTMVSEVQGVKGDEAGVGKGVKSGTHAGGGVSKPVASSTTTLAQKALIVRHGDRFTMNGGNTLGTLVYQPGGGPQAQPDAKGQPAKNPNPPAPPETPKETGFLAGLKQSAGEAWADVKGQAGTLWDATGITSTPEAASAARGAIWDGTKAVGQLASDVGQAANPAAMLTPWGRAAQQRVFNTGSAAAGAVADRYVNAYNQGGLTHALGVGTGDTLRLGVEALGSKGVGLAAKGATVSRVASLADKAADVAKVADKAADAARAADKVADAARAADKAADAAKAADKAADAAKAADKAEDAAKAADKAEDAKKAADGAGDAAKGDDGVRVKKGDGDADAAKKAEADAEAAKKKKLDDDVAAQHEKIKNGDFTPDENPALWTGPGAEDAARNAGSSMLNQTPGGKDLLDFSNANAGNLPWSAERPLWDAASARYANGIADLYGTGGRLAGQPVNAFVSSAERAGNIFRTIEEPILRARGVNLNIIPVRTP